MSQPHFCLSESFVFSFSCCSVSSVGWNLSCLELPSRAKRVIGGARLLVGSPQPCRVGAGILIVHRGNEGTERQGDSLGELNRDEFMTMAAISSDL